MNFELSDIALVVVGYMVVLFSIAYCAERGWIPEGIARHPVTYVLSLGISASAWAYYGIVDLAFQYGYGALAYYLGAGAMFLFAPIALAPLAQLARRFQIGTMADLLVFRYHNQAVGSLATFCMLIASLPLLALQIQAVADTLHILTMNSPSSSQLSSQLGLTPRESLALFYCFLLATFTILFGSSTDRRDGLIVAMAFESIIKVVALCAVGLVAVYGVFGGLGDLDQWLVDYPENMELLYSPIGDGAWHTLVLVFLATTFAMPHTFQMSTVDNSTKDTSAILSWAFPLFLLLMALPLFPILWAGFELNVPLPAQYFALGIPIQMEMGFLTLLVFIGGLSAATGAMVALTLALSTMLLNHWVLPVVHLSRKRDLYRQLLWLRRLMIVAFMLGGYIFYQTLDNNFSLTNLALLTFIEILQFLPGIFAISYWPTANSRGFIAGLSSGTAVWFFCLLLPSFVAIEPMILNGWAIPTGLENWSDITLLSLSLNITAFVVFSIFGKTSEEERYSAELCAEDELSHPLRMVLDVHSASDFSERLSKALGQQTAERELNRALEELKLGPNERRPYALRRLRDRIEANLSGLMGTAVANELMDRHIPYHLPEAKGTADINLIENRLTQYRSHLTGLAGELNNLRLYHRNTLEELPMAATSLGRDMEILMWNHAMEDLTGILSDDVLGSHLDDLRQPWRDLLDNFSRTPDEHLHRQQLELQHGKHWISLHKANIAGPVSNSTDGQVILLEDVTEIQLLEQELLHSERLASVGRLAAGVAHEIGNPITGIACLAQNLKYEDDNPEAAAETAEMILSQTDRVGRIVQSLVSFSHTGQQEQDDFIALQVVDCVSEAVSLLSLQKEKNPVQFTVELDDLPSIYGDPQRLIQVFINLLSNARDASPVDGLIRVYSMPSSDPTLVTIHVEDEGVGIPEKHREKVLEPFFTSKEPGEGTGLGLAMVYSIIEEHKGQLTIDSPVPGRSIGANQGTRITIKLSQQPPTTTSDTTGVETDGN